MQNLEIAIIQSEIVWHNASQNRINFEEKINKIKSKIDLFVLPEMFSTGFSMTPQPVAETMCGQTVLWMQKIANKKQCAITGSVIIKEENKFYNRLLFVFPSGEIEYYDKSHLFFLTGEDKVYTKGKKKIIINYKGWKICPFICYDLRFPVYSRNVENYDILLYVSNWPKQRIVAWNSLLKARSIENMCYTIGVNRVGTDANNFEYNGHSGVYDCLGKKIVKIESNKEIEVKFSLDKKHLKAERKKLAFLNDRDFFEITE